MKVKQVVGEHKKGFRAKKYASKPKNTIAPKKPEPIKPVGTVKPGDMVKEDPMANVAVKPVTGASEVDVNGQKIATTTDASAAATIAQLAKDGKIAVPPQNNQNGTTPTSMEEEQPGSDPQMTALQQLMTTAQQPWEQAQIKWRMDNLKSQQSMAGEPGGGNGAPVDAHGNLIPVLPTKDWMAKNPNVVKQLPNEALPPEMQRPGMLDRMKSLAGIK